MYVTKVTQRKGGRTYSYWTLRETLWDSKERRSSQRYLASLGPRLTISLDRVRELAEQVSEKTGGRVTVEDLRKVRRLRIVENGKASA